MTKMHLDHIFPISKANGELLGGFFPPKRQTGRLGVRIWVRTYSGEVRYFVPPSSQVGTRAL